MNQKGIISHLLLLTFILVGAFLVLFFSQTLPQTKKLQATVENFTPLFSNATPSPTPVMTVDSVTAEVIKIVDEQDPRKALDRLEEITKTNSEILNNCHGIVHAIGHEAYKKYQDVDKALEYTSELCGSGYIHGVIEQRLANVIDVYSELKTICKTDSGNCYHGVGHGLMFYTNNEIPQALKYCSQLPNQSAQVYCSEGVFMENFNIDQAAHPSKYLDPNDPLYPCALQEKIYKPSCYFYAPDYYFKLHPGDYTGVFSICDKTEEGYRSSCIRGSGSRIMKRNIDNPKAVETFCDTLSQPDHSDCIDGMVSYYIVNFYSVQKGYELCQTLTQENQPICQKAVDERKGWFAD